jgi:hypothetical protein
MTSHIGLGENPPKGACTTGRTGAHTATVFITFLAIWTAVGVIGTAVLIFAMHGAQTLQVRPALVGMLGSQVVVRRPDGTLATIDLAEPAHAR